MSNETEPSVTLTQAQIDLMLAALTQMTNILSAATVVIPEVEPEPVPEPEPDPIEDEDEDEFDEDEPVGGLDAAFGHNGIKFYKHFSLSMAKEGFKNTYGTNPVDNDKIDGMWYSASAPFGKNDLPKEAVDTKPKPTPVDPTTDDGGEGSGSGVTGVISGSKNMQVSSGKIYSAKGSKTGHSGYNSSHHERLNTFKNSKGEWKQRWAYYAADQNITIVERDFPNGKWEKPVNVHNVVNAGGKGDPTWRLGTNAQGFHEQEVDNHNNVTTNTTASGRAVVCGNMHAHYIKIAVSDTDDLNGKWTSFDYKDFPGDPKLGYVNHKRCTYPALVNYNGNIILSVRGQTSGGGKANAPWYWTFYQFNEKTNKWSHLSTIMTAKGARTYMSNPAITTLPNGKERIAITGIFRNEVQGGGDAHYDLLHFYSDDGKDWKQFNLNNGGSTNVNGPVSFKIKESGGDNRSDAPVKIWDTVGRGDPKQASYATGFGADNMPFIYVTSRGTLNGKKRHIFTHGAAGWKVASEQGAFSNQPDTARCFALPSGDTGIVWACGNDIRFMNLNPKAGENYSKGRVLASGLTSGGYTIIIDERAKDQGWLSMQLFKSGGTSQPAHTVSIPLSEVETLNTPFK